MILKELANTLESNQKAIEAHGKLDEKMLQKVSYKIRLDWNYYSNRMEGGTLTAAETRSVMIGNIDIKGKPMKDVIEMNGHDQVVLDILSMAGGKMRLSEKRIKDIHKAIMHESDKEKQKQIGIWKTAPNEIINYKNEKVRFTEPADVAEEMHELLNWLNTQIDHFHHPKKTSLHPVEIVAKFHLDYVRIHPFYDGNGRTARILTNLILISFGYPPIIVKDEHKKQYYNLLGDIQSYGGKPDLFYDFVAKRVIDTQEIYLKVISGESIEEEDDLDKRIKLLDQKYAAIPEENEVKTTFNSNVVNEIFNGWFTDLIRQSVPVIQKFNKYFIDTNHQISITGTPLNLKFSNEPVKELLRDLKINAKQHFDEPPKPKPLREEETTIYLRTFYGTFKKSGITPFGCNYGFDVKFEHITYTLTIDEFSPDSNKRERSVFAKRLLSQPLYENEIKQLVDHLSKVITDHIEFYIDKENRKKAED